MAVIAYVVNSLNLGGTEHLVVQMSEVYRNEHDILIICLDEPGLWAERLREQGIAVHCCRRQPGLDLNVARKIANICQFNKVDIIHAHQCTAWFYSALSRLIYRKNKLLFEEHGRHYPEVYSWKKNFINKLVIQHLTHVTVAVSEDVRKRLVKYEGLSQKNIQVVYNGVHSPVLISAEKRKKIRNIFGIAEDDFLIGSVGRLDAIKNYPMLLAAFARFVEKYPKAKLMLVGDGPEKKKLHELATELGCEADVIFTGYRSDATELLQCFDLFVLCSFSEGTSMALLEAMASSIASVVTDVGGNPELIVDKVNGWVITSDDDIALENVMLEAINNKKQTVHLAQMAKKRYEEQFTFEAMIARYRSMYSTLIGQQK
ncbi:glycosyltransferase [Desulfogranum marinum]|uniref:glycosyltransferase n=1 Tax=Desulfogranum marinum TaxID=453220 RepID=UPI001E3733F2|nr:glycosyltransferase [Desulfogranum marinum]MBM9514554.1 glycosyltransferase [Desulfogranum marinum]